MPHLSGYSAEHAVEDSIPPHHHALFHHVLQQIFNKSSASLS
jgi:hypothetical protein